jgi:hypothetical protein
MKEIFCRQNFLHPDPPDLLLDDSALRFPESTLVDESEAFSCQYHSTMVLHAHISPGG